MNNTKVAIDINDLQSEAVLDALLNEKGEVFRTARGRKAILIGQAAFQRVQKDLSLYVEGDNDGNQVLKA